MVTWIPARSLSLQLSRSFSSGGNGWAERFIAATGNVDSKDAFVVSANKLRELTRSDLIRGTDIRDNPERFFEAHRLLARHTVKHGPGFWIRFTVHYNLFAGTILAVGTDEQVAALAEYQAGGLIGCFGLTEKLAGVQSGLVVETTATWDQSKGVFVLNTPHGDKTVVVADLIVGGASKGPHAFVVDFRVNGRLVDHIAVDDMGPKTVGNDLDNAWIAFDNLELPKTALLSKHADVVNGKYELKSAGVRPFEMIGQRLYTGRVAVAQAALEYRKQLFKQTQEYSDKKRTYSRDGKQPVLSDIPQLRSLYKENAAKTAEIERFVASCEAALSACLRAGAIPSPKLVDAIATAKVLAVEDSIAACFRLKQEVGSFALMDDAGFKHLDFLQCCKFAEGDSRILMQKLARDRFKLFGKEGAPTRAKGAGGMGAAGAEGPEGFEGFDAEELARCAALAARLGPGYAMGGGGAEGWDREYEAVYALAHAVMARVQRDGVGPRVGSGPASPPPPLGR